jgi:hypothetical protein
MKQFLQNESKTHTIGGIITEIEDEIEFAMRMFPKFPGDPIHSVAIMGEESGESIQAALQWVYEDGNMENLRKELIQTAAMCVRVISGLDTGDITKPSYVERLGP